MTNNFLAFWPDRYIYIGATFPITLSQLRLPAKIVVIKIEKDIIPQKMIKRGSKEDKTNFLQMLNKLSSKKKRQINKSKQKTSIREISSRKATINSLDSSDKKELPIPIAATKKSDLKTKNINRVIIGVDVYCIACCLKWTQVFVILMRDIWYQAEKEDIAITNPKSVVPQEYHNFLGVSLKKNSDTLFLYQKYDHKIYLEEEWKHSHATLYKRFSEKLNAVKQYLNFHLAKKFI